MRLSIRCARCLAAMLWMLPALAGATPEVLFDGKAGPHWLKVEAQGGRHDEFARYGDGKLIIDVPPGNGWGMTGIRSAAPLVPLPHPDADEAVRLEIGLDTRESGPVHVSLVPPSRATQSDPGNHDLRLALAPAADGKHVEVSLWADGREQGRRNVEDRSRLDSLRVFLRPDALVLVEDAQGEKLFEATLPQAIPDTGWHLQVVARAARKDERARLVLNRIAIDREAFTRHDDPHAMLQESSVSQVLFDGRQLGPHWSILEARGNKFKSDVRFLPGYAVFSQPAASNGPLGIYTEAATIWLDRFGAGAQTRLDYTFVPEATTAFTIALAPPHNLSGNTPENQALLLSWQALAPGQTEPSIEIRLSPPQVRVRSARAPQTVGLLLAPGGFRIEAEGFPRQPFAWNQLADGQGLRGYVYLERTPKDGPTRMAIKEITMRRQPGAPLPDVALPLADVAPLPERVVFAGDMTGWNAHASGGASADAAVIGDAALQVTLDGSKRDASAGILSTTPLIRLDERIRRTPLRITQRFDPRSTTAFTTLLAEHGDPVNARRHYKLAISLAPAGPGPHQGDYLLSLHDNGVYNIWQRPIAAEHVARHWDGRVMLELGEHRATAILPGIGRISAASFMFQPHSEYWLMVDARPARVIGPLSMRLLEIRSGWATPPLMDALERLELVDFAEFDADAYLRELSRGVTETLP